MQILPNSKKTRRVTGTNAKYNLTRFALWLFPILLGLAFVGLYIGLTLDEFNDIQKQEKFIVSPNLDVGRSDLKEPQVTTYIGLLFSPHIQCKKGKSFEQAMLGEKMPNVAINVWPIRCRAIIIRNISGTPRTRWYPTGCEKAIPHVKASTTTITTPPDTFWINNHPTYPLDMPKEGVISLP